MPVCCAKMYLQYRYFRLVCLTFSLRDVSLTIVSPLTIWVYLERAHQKNKAPVSIRGPSEYQGPL